MREMKDSGVKWIGEIPEDWKISKVKYHVENLDGKRVPIDSALRVNGIYPYWGAGSITDYVDDYLFDEELILLGEDGAPFFDPYRPVAFLVNEKIWVNNHIHVLRPKSSINALFVTYFLNIVDYGTYINGTILNKLTQSNLKKIAIVYPSLEKQEKIVHYLDDKCSRIDFIISKQKQIIGKLKNYKLSLISETVLRGLNKETNIKDSGFAFIGNIPCNWSVWRLRDIGILQNGISKGGEYFGQGYPFVSYGDVYRNYSLPMEVSGLIESTDEERKKYSVEKGDIFFTRTSETIDEVGFSCVCENTIENATFAGFLIRVRPKTNALNIGYAKYYFISNHLREYLAKEMNLVTRASLGQGLLKSMPVLIPPKKEQALIAHYIDRKCLSIDSQIQKRERMIEKLQDYKKSLIYECVTGKKEVSSQTDHLSNTGIKPSVLKQIRNYAKQHRVHKVILFGSRARGTFHRDSDIDLAVSGGNIDFFRLAVEEETDTLLAYDVVNLDRTSNEELLDVIRKEGVIIYEEV